MSTPALRHQDSVDVAAPPEAVYDLVSDVTRTGEWSVQCHACEWADPDQAGRVGAVFTGHNRTGDREWSTRSTVVAADRPTRFAWEVGAGFVRWTYDVEETAGGSRLTHTWEFLPAGLDFFATTYGETADAEIAQRSEAARSGVPETLARLRGLLEGGRD